MTRSFALVLGRALAGGPQDPPAPVALEQIVARENPAFHIDGSLTVGRDGLVYLTNVSGDSCFLLRVRPDGSEKRGSPIVYAAANATANADGTIASANGHFAHKVSDAPPQEWRLVRADLWEVFKKPVRVRGLRLAAVGGDAGFDRILLARSPNDLPAQK